MWPRNAGVELLRAPEVDLAMADAQTCVQKLNLMLSPLVDLVSVRRVHSSPSRGWRRPLGKEPRPQIRPRVSPCFSWPGEEDDPRPSIWTWSDGPGRLVPLRSSPAADRRAPPGSPPNRFSYAPRPMIWAGPVLRWPDPYRSSPQLFFLWSPFIIFCQIC
jgi:hypothetical protein